MVMDSELLKIDLQTIPADFPYVVFSTSVYNLGIVLDQQLTFSEHLNILCHACFLQLRQLWAISHSLSPYASLIFVCNGIDYCNAIYVGLILGCFVQLQRVLRAAYLLLMVFEN